MATAQAILASVTTAIRMQTTLNIHKHTTKHRSEVVSETADGTETYTFHIWTYRKQSSRGREWLQLI